MDAFFMISLKMIAIVLHIKVSANFEKEKVVLNMQYESMLKLWKRIFDTWGNLEIILWIQNKTST